MPYPLTNLDVTTGSLSDFFREMRCRQKMDGCKAQIADNGYSIVKICNTADAIFADNPPGRGDFYVLLRCGLLVWNNQTALYRSLHYKKIIPVALAKEVRQAPSQSTKPASRQVAAYLPCAGASSVVSQTLIEG